MKIEVNEDIEINYDENDRKVYIYEDWHDGCIILYQNQIPKLIEALQQITNTGA